MLEIPPTGQVRSMRTPSTLATDQSSTRPQGQTSFSVRDVLAGTARVLHILAAISVHLSKSIGRKDRPFHLAGLQAKQAPPRRAPHDSTAPSPVKPKSWPRMDEPAASPAGTHEAGFRHGSLLKYTLISPAVKSPRPFGSGIVSI